MPARRPAPRRAALAGAAAAAAWAAVEPAARRLCGTPYSDLRLLGRIATSGPAWPVAGLAMHLANGAAFGVAFDRLGGRGARQGLAAAMVETAATWPGMLLIDRFHPDRRNGTWPRLVGHGPTIAEQVLVHAVFGVVLGTLLDGRD